MILKILWSKITMCELIKLFFKINVILNMLFLWFLQQCFWVLAEELRYNKSRIKFSRLINRFFICWGNKNNSKIFIVDILFFLRFSQQKFKKPLFIFIMFNKKKLIIILLLKFYNINQSNRLEIQFVRSVFITRFYSLFCMCFNASMFQTKLG